MNEQKVWRVLHVRSDTFAPLTYTAHGFDDAIMTIGILGRPESYKDYAVQHKKDGTWVTVPHSL